MAFQLSPPEGAFWNAFQNVFQSPPHLLFFPPKISFIALMKSMKFPLKFSAQMATLLCHRRKSYAEDAAGLFCRLLGDGRHLSKHPLTLLLSVPIKWHRSNVFDV
jgi:hypothetical protein